MVLFDHVLLLLFGLCCSFNSFFVHGVYFHVSETDHKCFIEEIPVETMVTGKYKVEILEPVGNNYVQAPPGMGMHVEVRDPEDKIVLSRVYSAEGRFTFTSHTPGEHLICMYANTTRWFGGGQLRVHLEISAGEHANDYAEIASKDKLSELQLRIHQLLAQVDQIAKEQNYQRYREDRFRVTSESTNNRVFWWAVAQTSVLVLIGVWQMRHLKSFFEAKKLV